MLRQEAGKSRKQKRTIKQLHADLLALGYDGSYNRVAAFARDWKDARQREQKTTGRGVFVPLAFTAGEAFQFDSSEDWAVIAGERTKLQVAHFKLSYSRAFFLRAYPQQTHEMLFDAHNHAFRVLGGIPRRGIYDNMRTAVDKIGRGRSGGSMRAFRPWSATSFSKRSSAIRRPGGRRADREDVQDARHRIWQPTPSFPSLATLNDWLETRCRDLWAQTAHSSQPGSVADAWAEEARHLMQLPRPFDGFIEYAKRVSPTCLVHLYRNRYSVPASFANRPVSVQVYPSVLLSSPKGRSCASTPASSPLPPTQEHDDRFHLAALSPVIQRKPGALRNGAPFAELPLPSRLCNSACSRRQAATARWLRFWPWFSSTTSKLCSRPSNWRWRLARRPRRIF